MSDQLPSRDEITEASDVADQLHIYLHKKEWDCISYPNPDKRVMLTILRMARLALSGRLVDREAIDYEAAKEQVRIWLTSVDIDDEPLAHSMSIAAVDAAIGDGDDK